MRLFPRFRPQMSRRSRGSSFCRSSCSTRSSLCNRRRCPCFGWCYCFSLEALHAFMKLFLLCVASCSWSLLIISLSLSTSRHPSKRPTRANEGSLVKEEKEKNPCLVCRSHHEGPSKTFSRNFHRPLKHILSSVNHLDIPLVSSDLRIHLAILEVILVQLLKTLRVSGVPEKRTETSRGGASRGAHHIQTNEATDTLKVVEKTFEVNNSKPLACFDQFLGTLVGYPRYKKGFATYRCSKEKLGKSVSIIIWDIDKSTDLMKHWDDKNISIFLLSNGSLLHQNSQFITTIPPYPSTGKAIRRILRYISTPYVLLSQGLHSLRKDTNFNRMIYVAEKTKVIAVSGSIRSEEDGKWKSGCQLFRETEGHMIFEKGYTSSMHECQLCHFAEGPVLLRTKWLIDSGWAQDHVPSDFLIPSLFFHLNENVAPYEHPILVCPDVMFRSNTLVVPWDIQPFKSTSVKTTRFLKSLWEGVARKKHLTKISLASGTHLYYPCNYLDSGDPHPYKFKENFSNLQPEAKSGAKACQAYELDYILSRIEKSCKELKLTCVLSGPISEVLIHVGDPLRLLQLQSKRPTVNVKVSSGNGSLSLFREMLRSQDLKNISKDIDGLIAGGKYWHVKVMTDYTYDQGIYRRVHVLDSLWMNCEFSDSSVNLPSFMKIFNKFSTFNLPRKNSVAISSHFLTDVKSLLNQRTIERINFKSTATKHPHNSSTTCFESGIPPNIVFNNLFRKK